jgi:hypothetical protein
VDAHRRGAAGRRLRRGRYEPARGPAIAWLLGIARNLLLDAARRGRVADAARLKLGMAPISLDDEALERIEARGRVDVEASLARLPESQRVAIVKGESPCRLCDHERSSPGDDRARTAIAAQRIRGVPHEPSNYSKVRRAPACGIAESDHPVLAGRAGELTRSLTSAVRPPGRARGNLAAATGLAELRR